MKTKGIYLIVALLVALAGWYGTAILLGPINLVARAGLTAAVLLAVGTVVAAFHSMPLRLLIAAGLLLLGLLCVLASIYAAGLPIDAPAPFGPPLGFTTVAILAIALAVTGVLLSAGLRPQASRGTPLALAVAGLLLSLSLYTLYWLIVWDSTYDPIGAIWLVFLVLVALMIGALLAISLPGRWKVAGLLFAVLMPVGLIAVTVGAQRVDFRDRTAARAERIGRAIESYYEREGHYPESLGDLIPRDTLYLPGPVIIFGQPWCYEGGGQSFRLGYVDREHWSDPRLAGRVALSVGETTTMSPICAAQIDNLVGRYPDFFAVAGE